MDESVKDAESLVDMIESLVLDPKGAWRLSPKPEWRRFYLSFYLESVEDLEFNSGIPISVFCSRFADCLREQGLPIISSLYNKEKQCIDMIGDKISDEFRQSAFGIAQAAYYILFDFYALPRGRTVGTPV